ncbi:hypothetical protein D6833_02545, partial [Candidatus Parcubacteria bacterium]
MCQRATTPLHWLWLVTPALLCMPSSAAASARNFLPLIESRGGRIETLTATVKVVRGRAAGFPEYFRAHLHYADYVEQSRKDPKTAASLREDSRRMIASYERDGAKPRWFRLRY